MKLKDHFCREYVEGVKEFMRVAAQYVGSGNRVRCPCKRCNNCCVRQLSDVKRHLLLFGILENYNPWVHHGERFQFVDHSLTAVHSQDLHTFEDRCQERYNDIPEMLEDLHRGTLGQSSAETTAHENASDNDGEVERLARLLNDANCELYPGCSKYSKLSFLLKMVHIKSLTNSSNKAFDMNLELFKDTLPMGETLPKSYYDVKKLLRDLGLGYIKIDVC